MTRLPILFLSGLLMGMAGAASPVTAQQPGKSGSAQSPAQGVRRPEAKSQAEFKDYNAAYAITGGAAMEKAADDFAAKYPASELRSFLYSKAMHEYQTENRAAKVLEMGDKVIALDPDDPVPLTLTAAILSDALSDSDKDREQKIAKIKKNAGHALQTVDTGMAPPANASPEQIAAYKNTLRSMAHSALGITALKTGDDAGAETELKAAADLNKADGYVFYHLALAQDHQHKYAEALASVQEALRSLRPEEELTKLAQGERARLELLLKPAGAAK